MGLMDQRLQQSLAIPTLVRATLSRVLAVVLG